MGLGLPKEVSMRNSIPRGLSSIATSVIILAVFVSLGTFLLASYPIGSAVREYLYDMGHFQKGGGVTTYHENQPQMTGYSDVGQKSIKSGQGLFAVEHGSIENKTDTHLRSKGRLDDDVKKDNSSIDKSNQTEADSIQIKNGGAIDKGFHFEPNETKETMDPTRTGDNTGASITENITEVEATPSLYPSQSESSKSPSSDAGCNLYDGEWVYDSSGPLYTNNSCPIITQMQNCQGNGRPDKEYENWRWKPFQCDLPRFDPKKFLELMRGKTLAFIGDSVARNQMESMLCILWQVEAPKNRGNKRMHRWYFKSTNTMIVRIWSSWLVHQTSDPVENVPAGVVKLHLDAPDRNFLDLSPNFDVVVLSSGHWFAKQSAYLLNNKIVGGQLWWPHKSERMKVNNIEAFGISVETILTSMAAHSNYTGLTIIRSYSPDHYEGGAWNTGGSCTGLVRPATREEFVENGYTKVMHEMQARGFERAVKRAGNRSRSNMRMMDITEAFSYRHDGHPGPYRNPDPNKMTKRGPDGRAPPQDCLHWCMPGPVDTWNEIVAELIRREFETAPSSVF